MQYCILQGFVVNQLFEIIFLKSDDIAVGKGVLQNQNKYMKVQSPVASHTLVILSAR